jgi:site-specific recombinase XerC
MIGATSAPSHASSAGHRIRPNRTVALYVTDLARRGRAPATIARRLVSIAVYHRAAGYASPTEHGFVRAVMSGSIHCLARIPGDVRGLRDRALLLIEWATALRRSEIAALVASDLRSSRTVLSSRCAGQRRIRKLLGSSQFRWRPGGNVPRRSHQ